VAAGLDDDVIVNIQGDEPLIEEFVIDAAVAALREDPGVSMATVVHPIDPGVPDDPNRVKVVIDRNGRALYFSRSPIPYLRPDGRPPDAIWQHVGLYAYRRPFLLDFVGLPATPAEQAEGLEQLRALEHGHPIRCAVVEGWHSLPVDVPEDVARVEARLAEGP
jgi:3-deoxy-manno-octulosonate cytidylyltransferase (CMP-KDO synthetase)